MTEENYQENNDVQPVVEAESVNEQEVAQTAPDSDKEMNFRAIRETLEQTKAELSQIKAREKETRDMLSMYQSLGNQSQPQAQQAQEPQPAPSFSPADFGDAVDSEAFNKMYGYVSQKEQQFQQQQQQMAQQLEEIKLMNQDSDYMGTIKKYLPDALEKNPALQDLIKSAPNPKSTAYHLATNSEKYIRERISQEQSAEAQAVVKNSRKPSTLGNVNNNRTTSSGDVNPMRLSDQDYYKERKSRFGF